MLILIAEDNEINQKVLMAIFNKNNYSFEIAQNGQEALDRIQNKSYDLILMDCQMPVLDGFTTTTLIREYETTFNKQRCPIIAITANAMQGDKEKCMNAGMDDFLSKPFKSQEIISVVNKWSKN